MSQLVDQASVIMTAQQRLRRLLIANRSIVQELSLPAVLRRILDTAKDVSGAKYAALGVIGSDGSLEEFRSALIGPLDTIADDAITKLGMQRRTQAAVYGATLRRRTCGVQI